jgi:hypothetical protein
MKTKRFYAVQVFDSTSNQLGHDFGIYGKGDFSWLDQPLNGWNGDYNMTMDEALAQKAECERIINERSLAWASADIDSIDVPYAETMQDIADYYNECECVNVQELEAMIEANGWVSDCSTDFGICHNEKNKVIINDDGKAEVI